VSFRLIINGGIEAFSPAYVMKQEGWLSPTERASVSAISLRHILASHVYAPGTIAVSVTWMEKGFNAGQTHSSIYPYIFNRLRAIARYWSQLFSSPLHLTPPLGCSHWNSRKKFGPQKTRIMGLPGSEDSLTIGWAISTQYQRVTDGRTDRRPAYSYNVRSMTDAR